VEEKGARPGEQDPNDRQGEDTTPIDITERPLSGQEKNGGKKKKKKRVGKGVPVPVAFLSLLIRPRKEKERPSRPRNCVNAPGRKGRKIIP